MFLESQFYYILLTKHMQDQYISKLCDPLDFSLSDAQNSFITYKGKRLYYTKFNEIIFGHLSEQYHNFTGKDLVINFNGLTLSAELQIQKIIETKEEERIFEYVLNQSCYPSITLTRQQILPFNRMVFRIISSGMFTQDSSIHQHQQIKQLQYSSQVQGLKKLQQHKLLYALGQKQELENIKCFANKNLFQQSQLKDKKRQNQSRMLMIYWVDDEPQNNVEIIQNYFRSPYIQVKQVVSTKDMLRLLQQEYQYKIENGFKILFISDMTRKEQDFVNYQAGIDLFEQLYHRRKLTDMGIAFVNSIEGTIFNMKKRNLNTNYIKVLNKTADLVATVLYYAPKQY